MSTLLEIKNNWNITKEEIKQKFAILSKEEPENSDPLNESLASLQERLARAKAELQCLISQL